MIFRSRPAVTVGLLLVAFTAAIFHSGRWRKKVTTVAGARPAQGEVSEASIYQLASRWTTDAGDSLRMTNLKSRVQVLALFYTQCPSACPVLIREIQALDASLPTKVRSRIGFILISMDPERDSPAALREYRKKMGLDPERWTLLQGNPEDVRELAAVLGFSYEKEGGMDIIHSNLVTILDPKGCVIHQQAGLGNGAAPMVSAIKTAVAL